MNENIGFQCINYRLFKDPSIGKNVNIPKRQEANNVLLEYALKVVINKHFKEPKEMNFFHQILRKEFFTLEATNKKTKKFFFF